MDIFGFFDVYTLLGLCLVVLLLAIKLTSSYNFDLFKFLKLSKEKKVVINEDHNVTFSV